MCVYAELVKINGVLKEGNKMRFEVLKALLKLFFLILCISCSGPNISIEKAAVHEGPVAEIDSDYVLGPGDRMLITYFFGTEVSEREYSLEVGDVLEIQFYYHPEINKTVTIRPDGKISLARKGDIHAAGLTTRELKEHLTSLYSDTFKKPLVTITLVEFNQALKAFKEAITSDRFGHSKTVLIRPDGRANFFYIEQDVQAAGLSLPQLQSYVSEQYKNQFDNLKITLALESTDSNLVYVSGQVARPDTYQLIQPTTVSQILSKAGIIWETAALDSIVVVSRRPDGRPIGRLIDLNKVIGDGNIEKDILLKRFDIVYVPKNRITKLNVFIEQYFSNIVPDWARFSTVYRIDNNN
jgi:polysaccharide export outer membrane protein